MSFEPIRDIAYLEALYGSPSHASVVKVADRLTEEYRQLIQASPFGALASVGAEGLDCSPRGELGGALKAMRTAHGIGFRPNLRVCPPTDLEVI